MRRPPKAGKSDSGPYLPLYQEPPEVDLSVNAIVELAIRRHRGHEAVKNWADQVKEKKHQIGLFDRSKEVGILVSRLTEQGILVRPAPDKKDPVSGLTPKEGDQTSFYSLLLVSLRSDDAQKEFVQYERNIFEFRLKDNGGLTLDIIPRDLFKASGQNIKPEDFGPGDDDYEYKIEFEKVFPFIDVRSVSLANGNVNLEMKDLIEFFGSLFQDYLVQKCAKKTIRSSSLRSLSRIDLKGSAFLHRPLFLKKSRYLAPVYYPLLNRIVRTIRVKGGRGGLNTPFS
jgi:hypothetical protein